MKKTLALAVFGMFFYAGIHAQNAVTGIVIDKDSENPLQKVFITTSFKNYKTFTNKSGVFLIQNIPKGSYVIEIILKGYVTQKFPVELSGEKDEDINLGTIYLFKDEKEEQDLSIISLTEDELNSEDGFTDNITGLLQASRDVFQRAAAFDFGSTFFKPRGLSSENGKVLINGIEMNKLSNGRPQWANWGGLNDVMRNQVLTSELTPNEYSFGGLAGVNSITIRASLYSKGGGISFASSNRSYQKRVMVTYNSGLQKNGWAYTVSASRRYGDHGYVKGTLYDSNSFFASAEKKLDAKHSINFATIYAQNRRGRSTALTDEIHRLKGRQYNPSWGRINGEIKNSRTREIIEPILMMNHYWTINNNTTLNTNLAYQFGFQGNTRIDNGGTRLINFQGHDSYIGGARNPSPDYYQNLPSFFLQDANPTAFDYEQAYLAQQEFITNGQLNWNDLFEANRIQTSLGHNSIYAIQEDRIDDKQFSFNSTLYTELTENIQLNTALNYRNLHNESYAKIKDLLGGTGFLDIDVFAEDDLALLEGQVLNNPAQSDLRNPNRVAQTGERYKYNYKIDASVIDAFVQAQFDYSTFDFYLAASFGSTHYQRNGIYENGHYPESNSFGKSKKVNFTNYGFKGGGTYKLSGQHLINFNSAYIKKAPNIRNSFENPRQNNRIVNGLIGESAFSIDASYILRTPLIKAKLTGYHINFSNGTEIGFFFTESGSSFVQEIITNIQRRNFGGELGIETKITPSITLKGVASISQYTYNNNPNVYYTSSDFDAPITYGNGTSQLKNLHVSGGPESAFQFGFEYRDPDYWWLGATFNHFSRAFVDASVLKRSAAFAIDFDLIPESVLNQGGNISGYGYNNYNTTVANQLLKQEQLDSYALINVIGGKSWKVGNYFIGCFATINNLLNKHYKTGGFEQSRRIGYRAQTKEQSQENGPLFGNRYFFGNGTTYYINLYLRF